MKQLILSLFAVLCLAACSAGPATTNAAQAASADGQALPLEGSWVQPVPGQQKLLQGFTLFSDGSAQSIHMATLVYETWRADGNTLILSGQSIGNGQTFLFTENYTFSFPQTDTLLLTDPRGGEKIFTRQK